MKKENKHRVYAAFRAIAIVTLCIIPFLVVVFAPCTPSEWTAPSMTIAYFLTRYGLPLAAIFGVVLGCKRNPKISHQVAVTFLAPIGFLFFLTLGTVFHIILFDKHPEEFKARQEWRDSAITDDVPFSIGFKDAHPFLAEYYRSIAFKSGKRLEIDMDTGGCRDFAVYEIGDGRYCIVDSFDYADFRGTYIINPESETVESKHRDEMPQKKEFLGTVSPSGELTVGGKEPVLEIKLRCP